MVCQTYENHSNFIVPSSYCPISDVAEKGAIYIGSKILLDARVNFQWGNRQNAEAIMGLVLSKPDWYNPKNIDAVATVRAMDIELLAALKE